MIHRHFPIADETRFVPGPPRTGAAEPLLIRRPGVSGGGEDVDTYIGILFGLGAAFAQALSYVFTRLFLARSGGGAYHLLAASHALMGIASLAVLLWLWPSGHPAGFAFLLPLVGASGFYLLGQTGLFVALRHAESSRVAPLLGLKIAGLAVLTTLWRGESHGLVRWSAVLLATAAAFLVQDAGLRMPRRGMGAVLVAVTGYCLSDMSIADLVRALGGPSRHNVWLAVALSYLLCGLAAAPLLAAGRGLTPAVWRFAAPHAASWFVAMLLLYACFGLVGVVLGNIVQATRGVLSVLFIPVLLRMGAPDIEPHISAAVFWKRAAGALLMVLAVSLYVAGH